MTVSKLNSAVKTFSGQASLDLLRELTGHAYSMLRTR